MYISSLGDMGKDEKKEKIVNWILHFDKKDKEEEEQQPDNKDKEEEQKQLAEEKNENAQAKQPDNTAEEEMGEDEQPKKKPRMEETSSTEETSPTEPTEETSPMEPMEDTSPEEAEADASSNHGSKPDNDSDLSDGSESLSFSGTSSYKSDDDTVSSEDRFSQKLKEKGETRVEEAERIKRRRLKMKTKKSQREHLKSNVHPEQLTIKFSTNSTTRCGRLSLE